MEIIKFVPKNEEQHKQLQEVVADFVSNVQSGEIEGAFILGISKNRDIYRWQYVANTTTYEMIGMLEAAQQRLMKDVK